MVAEWSDLQNFTFETKNESEIETVYCCEEISYRA